MKQKINHWAKTLLVCALVAIGCTAHAQNFTITGTVTNLSGVPLPGIDVYTFDTTALSSPNPVFYNTITDAFGNYTQIVPNGAAVGPNIDYIVGVLDCSGNFQPQFTSNQQGTVASAILNFSVCDSISIIVNPICTASFYYYPDTLPYTLTFVNHNIIMPPAGNPTATYLWSFGDGTTSTQASPTHTYAAGNQTYNVCLTYTDSAQNCTDTYCDNFVYVDSTYWYNCDATFTGSPSWSGAPNGIDFWANGVHSAFTTNTYTWDFGDGTTYTGMFPPTHIYPASGAYYACLTVANPATGCNTTFCDSVRTGFIVNPWGCAASYWATPDSVSAAGTVNYNFFDASWFISPTVTYLWDFGDGTTSTLQNPQHTYTNLTGSYSVCLTITDSTTTCNNTYCQQIYMPNSPCGSIGIAYTAVSGNVVIFSSNITPVPGINYLWDFGDNATSTQPNPTHTYSSIPGGGWVPYFVTLTITDSVSNCSGNTGTHLFFAPPCNSTYIIQSMQNPTTIQFSSNSAGALGYSFVWDFGDGTTSTQASPTHTYTNSGFYLATLTYTDSINACTAVTTAAVFGQVGLGCQPNFIVSPAGLTLTLIDNSFTSWGTQAQNYLWDFGDGNVSAQRGNVTHTYAQLGIYNICLTISDSSTSCYNTMCGSVSVNTTGGGGGSFAIGVVLADSIPVQNATVYLIEQSASGAMNIVDTMNTDASGLYYFMPQVTTTYYIKAAPQANSTVFATHLPTYYGDVLTWQSATPYIPNGGVTLAPISLVPVALRPGTAQVMGSVANGGYMPVGSSMAGLSVVMMDNNAGNLTGCTHTLTQANGTYTLPTVDYGSYKVMVEIPGMPTAQHSITLSAGAPMANNINFLATTNSIALAFDEAAALRNSLQILPNPNNGNFVLNLTLIQPENNAQVRIIDALGREMQTLTTALPQGETALSLQAQNLNEGVYFVEISTQQAKAHIKFVKTK
jgi:PKD repeat protein